MVLGLWQKHFSPCHSPSRPPSRRTDSLLQPARYGSLKWSGLTTRLTSQHQVRKVCCIKIVQVQLVTPRGSYSGGARGVGGLTCKLEPELQLSDGTSINK